MGALESTDIRWLVVYAKPRQERVAQEHLCNQGFECFLPRAYNPGRRLKSEKPRIEALFPRYLFAKAVMGEDNVSAIKYTRGVSRLVKFGGHLATAPDRMIEALKSAVDPEDGLLRLCALDFEAGDQVLVFDGPLAGLRGIFQCPDGESRAILLMTMLGKTSPINVDNRVLRKVS